MIYFDEMKQPYQFEIENPICVIEESLWEKYSGTDKWDIVDNEFVDITKSEEYQVKKARLEAAKEVETLKKELLNSDYMIIKTMEASISGNAEPYYNIHEIIEGRNKKRARINELEALYLNFG